MYVKRNEIIVYITVNCIFHKIYVMKRNNDIYLTKKSIITNIFSPKFVNCTQYQTNKLNPLFLGFERGVHGREQRERGDHQRPALCQAVKSG